jgi:hypothetical protein
MSSLTTSWKERRALTATHLKLLSRMLQLPQGGIPLPDSLCCSALNNFNGGVALARHLLGRGGTLSVVDRVHGGGGAGVQRGEQGRAQVRTNNKQGRGGHRA